MSRGDEPSHPCDLPLTCRDAQGVPTGLTIREHFAAMAMQGLLASNAKEVHADYAWAANRAVVCADFLLAELAKPRGDAS